MLETRKSVQLNSCQLSLVLGSQDNTKSSITFSQCRGDIFCITGLHRQLLVILHSSGLLGIIDQEITWISNYLGHDERETITSIKPKIKATQNKGCNGGRISKHYSGRQNLVLILAIGFLPVKIYKWTPEICILVSICMGIFALFCQCGMYLLYFQRNLCQSTFQTAETNNSKITVASRLISHLLLSLFSWGGWESVWVVSTDSITGRTGQRSASGRKK